MAQNYITIDDVIIKQPEKYSVSIATTSTEDSGRNQYLKMLNTPMGSIDGYQLQWGRLTTSELSTILQLVIDKSKFKVHYLDACSGSWKDGYFYAANYTAPAIRLTENSELWENLSFQISAIDPISIS